MHQKLMGLVFATIIFSVQAISSFLLDNLEIIADAYYDLGQDNNYLDSIYINSDAFLRDEYIQEISMNDPALKDLTKAIKECVFMDKGAYGNHLEKELQHRITGKYANFMYEMIAKAPDLANIFLTKNSEINPTSGIFGAPCSLGVEYQGKILFMRSAAMD